MLGTQGLVQSFGIEIVYLLLMAGMWFTITAVYIPGLGLPETGALVTIGLSIFGLISITTYNASGIIALAVAVGIFLAAFYFRHRWELIAAGFAVQLIGSILFFQSPYTATMFATVLIANAVAIAYHQIILLPGLRAQDSSTRYDISAMIGMTAQVSSALDPVGTVRLAGETWVAHATSPVEAGSWVRIVRREGLQLEVEPAPPPDPLD